MGAWIAVVTTVGALVGLTACSNRPSDQQDACLIAIDDAYHNGLSDLIYVAETTDGVRHYQAMVDAQAAASELHTKIMALVDRDISAELKQVLTDGAKMIAELRKALEDVFAKPPHGSTDRLKLYRDRVDQACVEASS